MARPQDRQGRGSVPRHGSILTGSGGRRPRPAGHGGRSAARPCRPQGARTADGQADREVEEDRRLFDTRRVDPCVHRESVRVGIGFRRWIEEQRLDAFCFNPLSLHRSGLVPFAFLEASRSMARGIGYAGEGDVATAALMAATFRPFPAAAFTEMFCPDWRRGRVLLSHTGESNPVVLAGRPRLVSKVHAVTGVVSAVCAGSLVPGPACLVNLSFSAPGDGPGFRVVVVRGDVQRDHPRGEMRNTIRGWFKPRMPFGEMLRAYSILGGSHHLVAVYGDVAEAFRVPGEVDRVRLPSGLLTGGAGGAHEIAFARRRDSRRVEGLPGVHPVRPDVRPLRVARGHGGTASSTTGRWRTRPASTGGSCPTGT